MSLFWKESRTKRVKAFALAEEFCLARIMKANDMFPALLFFLPSGIIGWLALLALIVAGVVIIIAIVKVVLLILPAAIVAGVVWLISGGDKILTGIAFVIVVVLSILKH